MLFAVSLCGVADFVANDEGKLVVFKVLGELA